MTPTRASGRNPGRNPAPAVMSVVAVAHTTRGLERAAELEPETFQWVEVRLDALAHAAAALERFVPRIRIPLLLTARHPFEGGCNQLSTEERRALLLRHLPHARLIDLELRSVPVMGRVLARARAAGAGLVLSFHDFRATPSAARLRRIVARATRHAPDIVKIASRTDNVAQFCRLLGLLVAERRQPLALMGMGTFAAASRLVAAQAGSRLNYGYLDRPQVEGQWPAALLRDRIAELCAAPR